MHLYQQCLLRLLMDNFDNLSQLWHLLMYKKWFFGLWFLYCYEYHDETLQKWSKKQKLYISLEILSAGVFCSCPWAIYMYKIMKKSV